MRAATKTAAILSALTLTAGMIAGRSVGQAAQTAGNQRIGEFAISNYARFVTTFGVNTIEADLSGPNLQITSAQYEMAAPKIQMTARKSGQKAPYKATRADATGGVRIVVRRPEAEQTTTVTCDNASYVASADPGATGRINLKGNVRSVTRDPAFFEPLVQTAQSGVIHLLGPNETRIELLNGGLTVTPKEPAPKPKAKPTQ